jgi:acetyl-CoA acetyltransferase family protein
MSKEVVIVDGARTPFGEFGGKLKDISAIDLGVIAAKAALERAHTAPEEVDHTVFGNVMQTSADAIYGGRHVALKSGVPVDKPAVTVNRICGSGLQAIIHGAQLIALGEADVVLAGGAENMSQAPHVIRGARWGLPLGRSNMEDSLWESLVDPYCDLGMANTAENLARQYNISRDDVDDFGFRSHKAAGTATTSGLLKEEMTPVLIKDRKGNETEYWTDEHIRHDVDREKMSKLKAVFEKDGVVTAGNASGINDGAAAVIMMSADRATEKGIEPLGRITAWDYVGVPPEIMGIGPAHSIRNIWKKTQLTDADIDLYEINEAFAAQYLAVEKELGLNRDKVNVNGGAVGLGHPLAASGTRLGLTILYELRRRGARRGIASLCIGGGQGIAALFERG